MPRGLPARRQHRVLPDERQVRRGTRPDETSTRCVPANVSNGAGRRQVRGLPALCCQNYKVPRTDRHPRHLPERHPGPGRRNGIQALPGLCKHGNRPQRNRSGAGRPVLRRPDGGSPAERCLLEGLERVRDLPRERGNLPGDASDQEKRGGVFFHGKLQRRGNERQRPQGHGNTVQRGRHENDCRARGRRDQAWWCIVDPVRIRQEQQQQQQQRKTIGGSGQPGGHGRTGCQAAESHRKCGGEQGRRRWRRRRNRYRRTRGRTRGRCRCR
mmetsp:Transcript_14940/g.33722  ORF Transcript_14940/g.33722 Transcript_14940/m.33722 type:complete len:270 (-) Transcript_14940:262-1071(-)